jgi:glycosyltransferase involved in cell wall biosynthesis
MKIGQVTYTYQPITGGGDVYASLLGQALAASGHEISVYQRLSPGVSDPQVRFIDNPLACLKKGEFWTQALFLPRQKANFLKEDLIIAHYPIYLLALARLRRGRSLPRIVGLSHGVTWDDGRLISSRIKRSIARRAFAQADSFVANDSYFLREMGLPIAPRQGLFSEVAENRWFIPNAMPPATAPAKPLPELQALKAVIVPRNFYFNRGIHLAVEAFRLFAPQHPETHLVILGAKSQPAYAAKVEARIRQLGLQDRVLIWGHVKHEIMESCYAGAEMCLIPSLCGEGTSLSALEAMAYGLATITTEVAGLKDLPSIQCPPEAEALAEAMLRTYPERQAIGEDQRTLVREHYSFERWAKTWREVIEKTASR